MTARIALAILLGLAGSLGIEPAAAAPGDGEAVACDAGFVEVPFARPATDDDAKGTAAAPPDARAPVCRGTGPGSVVASPPADAPAHALPPARAPPDTDLR